MTNKLHSESRTLLKNKFNKLKKKGLIPAAIYGFNGNLNIQIQKDKFERLYSETGGSAIVEIDLGGETHNCYVQEVQINPVTRSAIHVSFREVNLNVETNAEIPFVLIGEENSPAVKDQESLIILSKASVELRGLPKNISQQIELDVSNFNAGDTIVLKDIKLPAGVEIVHADELDETVVTTTSAIQTEEDIDVNAATAEAVAATEAPAEGAEAAAEGTEEKKEESKE